MGANDPERLWQQLTARCPLDNQGCPTPAELSAFAAGELDPTRRDSIAALVGNCAQCAAGVRLALAAELAFPEQSDMTVPAPSPMPALHRPDAGRKKTVPWLAGGMALLVLAAVAGLALRGPASAPGPDVLRGASEPATLSPEPGAQVQAPLSFRWPAASGAACRVQLRDGGGALVFESRAVDSGAQAGPEGLSAGRYRWTLLCANAAPRGPYAFELVL